MLPNSSSRSDGQKINLSRWQRKIYALKKQLNAVILAPIIRCGIQDVADFVAILSPSPAGGKDAGDVMFFCGVHFHAETAKILNPNKIVVLPDRTRAAPGRKLRRKNCRVAEKQSEFLDNRLHQLQRAVKALCDVICTSGNAEKIVRAARRQGHFVRAGTKILAMGHGATGRPMLCGKEIVTHVEFARDSLLKLKAQFPDAKVVGSPPRVCARCEIWRNRSARRRDD